LGEDDLRETLDFALLKRLREVLGDQPATETELRTLGEQGDAWARTLQAQTVASESRLDALAADSAASLAEIDATVERLQLVAAGSGAAILLLAGLGGLRHARPDSINAGWRNASFRGYADYMQTQQFDDSLRRCIDFAKRERVVLMCAEAVPWRCHRSLIADALLARGIAVSEITSGVRAQPHALTPWARLKGTTLTYPAAIGKTH